MIVSDDNLRTQWLAEDLHHASADEPTWRRLVLHKAERIRTFEALVLPLFLARRPTSFLEVGCGLGYAAALVKGAMPRCRVVATDLVAAYLRHTEAVGRFMEGIADDYLAAPAEALPFPNSSFEAIFSQMVLYRAADPAQAIQEARRVLAPTGIWIAVERASPWAWPWSVRERRHFERQNGRTGCRERALSRRQWGALFAHAGVTAEIGWLVPKPGRAAANAIRAEHAKIIVEKG